VIETLQSATECTADKEFSVEPGKGVVLIVD
jgi:hypothetical protein